MITTVLIWIAICNTWLALASFKRFMDSRDIQVPDPLSDPENESAYHI